MSKHIIVDIETTGFNRQADDIIAFSFIELGTNYSKVLDVGQLYFYYPGQAKSSPGAFNVHGISEEFLKKHETEFRSNIQKMYKKLYKANTIGYYSNTFDLPFISVWFERQGYDPLDLNTYKDLKDAYSESYGRVKLTELLKLESISDVEVKAVQRDIFKGYEFYDRPHDAAYDCTATYLLLKKAVREGLFR